MKKIMLVGRIGSGKTTLSQRITEKNIKYDKTQMIEFGSDIIDTPGEYLESRGYYPALIVTSMEADYIGLVMDGSSSNNSFPPEFAKMFTKPVIGIITKIDLLQADEDYGYAENILKLAGVQKTFAISSVSNYNVEKLVKYLT